MKALTLIVPWRPTRTGRGEPNPTSEWLVTNGRCGYAAGTVTGTLSRRYHGLLIAARQDLPGRYVLLNQIGEALQFPDGQKVILPSLEQVLGKGKLSPAGPTSGMAEFRLEMGLPGWRFELDHVVLEKHVLMPYRQDTVLVRYRLVEGNGPLLLDLHPIVHFRHVDAPVNDSGNPGPYSIHHAGNRHEIHGKREYPPLRLFCREAVASFRPEEAAVETCYAWEEHRGNPDQGTLWTMGAFRIELQHGEAVTLIASAEEWPTIEALQPQEAFDAERDRREQLLAQADPRTRSPEAGQLVLAADQFIVQPVLHGQSLGPSGPGEAKTLLAGYHWFTDWGRDAMISLEGLTLLTGRHTDARSILLTFAAAIQDGLVPNLFPEGKGSAVYHTADASLWFLHAVERYVEITRDHAILSSLLPAARDIVRHYLDGTRFGIGVDPSDGLLRQGTPGLPLTWMDAQVGDWVVTPRRGKAVEINALWYNALRLLEKWLREHNQADGALEMAAQADRVWRSFNDRFWYDEGGYLYDVVDGETGDDSLCRPNQVFSLSLRYPVLDPNRWHEVFEVIRRRLLTPVGLRSLAPASPGYQSVYFGDRRSRDAAYHQGTVWPWLLGPYCDAWLRVHPEDHRVAHQFLIGILQTLGTASAGSLNEIFDAQAPYTPRGCIAQAWSVAEVLRAWIKTQ
jgi:predicted glycogen debranching enzyme